MNLKLRMVDLYLDLDLDLISRWWEAYHKCYHVSDFQNIDKCFMNLVFYLLFLFFEVNYSMWFFFLNIEKIGYNQTVFLVHSVLQVY